MWIYDVKNCISFVNVYIYYVGFFYVCYYDILLFRVSYFE